jgi:hypothetical protein
MDNVNGTKVVPCRDAGYGFSVMRFVAIAFEQRRVYDITDTLRSLFTQEI